MIAASGWALHPRPRLRRWLLLSLLGAAFEPGRSFAQPDQPPVTVPVSEPSGGADAGAPDAGGRSPAVAELLARARHIEAFTAGRLEAGIDASGLFDVPLGASPAQLRVEVRRLEMIVERAGEVDAPPPPSTGQRDEPADQEKTGEGEPTPAARRATAVPYVALHARDRALWRARIAVDRAALAFLRLPAERRAALLAEHAERSRTETTRGREQAIDEAERAARRAEEQQRIALETAKRARSEAVRLINEEYARLLSITQAQARLEATELARKAELDARGEKLLGWRRRVSELTSARRTPDVRSQADLAYSELRQTLVETRSALADTLAHAGEGAKAVPRAGESRLEDLPPDADATVAQKQLALVREKEAELVRMEEELEARRSEQLMLEVETLNRLRLDLVSVLSPTRRSKVLAFGPTGWDQAGSEVRQVMLTLRYHVHAAYRWFVDIRGGTGRGRSAWLFFVLTFKWIFPLGVFWWWRRRADSVLQGLRKRLKRHRPSLRESRLLDSRVGERAIEFATRVRRPFEWLVLVGAISWLIPEQMRDLLEVRLLSTVLLWVFGGLFIVLSLDALSSIGGARRLPKEGHDTSELRFRSLRLVGRATVVFGLLLSLTDLLVGKGTIYSWVFSTCWFAAVPLLLVIIAWWRPHIFRRFSQMRKPNSFDRWVLSRRDATSNALQSVISSLAAVAGGVYLFSLGSWRVVRGRVLTFHLTRKLLAYLFQRDMSKKAQNAHAPRYEALAPNVFELLGPEQASEEHVKGVADAQVDQVIERIRAAGGGAVAIVGERGAGKSTLLARITQGTPDVVTVRCSPLGAANFSERLSRALELDAATPLEQAVAHLDVLGSDPGLLIDDAHHLVRSTMGGLEQLDGILDLCRTYSAHCTWIFAFDDVIWRFVERMRGTRPLFDDVIRLRSWNEEDIVRLLTHRNRLAEVQPDFSHLAVDLPADADDIDRREAIRNTEANYYRLLWDYAAGNPGVALHFWRRSLGVDADGRVRVRLFDAPRAADLDDLPDEAVFVLRAIVQLGWATLEEIQSVTSLPRQAVQDAVRYGGQRGYFERLEERYSVHWDWFRAITRFLQRKHLLAETP